MFCELFARPNTLTREKHSIVFAYNARGRGELNTEGDGEAPNIVKILEKVQENVFRTCGGR